MPAATDEYTRPRDCDQTPLNCDLMSSQVVPFMRPRHPDLLMLKSTNPSCWELYHGETKNLQSLTPSTNDEKPIPHRGPSTKRGTRVGMATLRKRPEAPNCKAFTKRNLLAWKDPSSVLHAKAAANCPSSHVPAGSMMMPCRACL